MLNGQLWIWSDEAVMGALGPMGGFKGVANFTKLNAKLYVYECMHIFLRGFMAVTLCNRKKKRDTICCLTVTKRNVIFIEYKICHKFSECD